MKKLVTFVSLFAFPFVAGAQSLGNLNTLAGSIGSIVNTLIPIVFALAMLFFFWGLARYILGSEHDKEKAKKTMIWGVVAIFIMAAIWGLVTFIGSALAITPGGGPGFTVGNLVPGP